MVTKKRQYDIKLPLTFCLKLWKNMGKWCWGTLGWFNAASFWSNLKISHLVNLKGYNLKLDLILYNFIFNTFLIFRQRDQNLKCFFKRKSFRSIFKRSKKRQKIKLRHQFHYFVRISYHSFDFKKKKRWNVNDKWDNFVNVNYRLTMDIPEQRSFFAPTELFN